jgi:hypothetical protein
MIEDDFHDAVDPAVEAVVHVRGLVRAAWQVTTWLAGRAR